MKQRRIGEYAVEMLLRQIELEKVLLPDLAAAEGARHGGKFRGAFQADSDMAEIDERLEIAPGPAAEIEDRERRGARDVLQQRRDVLADVVIARTTPEVLGALVVVRQRDVGDLGQFLRAQ